jgi:hypothetical protein
MKKVLYSVLFAAIAGFGFTACSNGDYNANPNSAANASINPLSPLSATAMAAFATGDAANVITATINGAQFSAHGDSGTYYHFDTAGFHNIIAYSGGKEVYLRLFEVYNNDLYTMGHGIYNREGTYASIDSNGHSFGAYTSYQGNSGEVYIIENDSAFIRGTFYFQGVDSLGDVINVNNGYFYLHKN